MNAKALKKLRRAARLVRDQMVARSKWFPEGLLGPPPTPRQVYRRLKTQEARHERPR